MFRKFFKRKNEEIIINDNSSTKDETSIIENEERNIYQKTSLSNEEIENYIKQEIQKRILEREQEQNIYSTFDEKAYDPMLEEAARLMVASQVGSTSNIQRKFSIGYNRAGRIMQQLELIGVVSSAEDSKARTVLISNLRELEDVLRGKPKKKMIFEENILPTKIEYIKKQVDEYFTKKKIEEENELKEYLKQELLQEDKEKKEKQRVRLLKEQLRAEMIIEGVIDENNDENNREPIPKEIQDRVWIRDGGKCVMCGSNEKLEFDHIIPFSKGGSNTYRNLQILCERCNRQKNNKIG